MNFEEVLRKAEEQRESTKDKGLPPLLQRPDAPTDHGPTRSGVSRKDDENGKQLRDCRLLMGLSVPEMANILGVAQKSLYGFESGHKPASSNILNKAKALADLYRQK